MVCGGQVVVAGGDGTTVIGPVEDPLDDVAALVGLDIEARARPPARPLCLRLAI